MDSEKIKQAVTLFLEGIGEDVEREGLIETPDRVARMCEEIYGGLGKTAEEHLSKQFTVDNNDIVLVKDIMFYSTCEHHLLPFFLELLLLPTLEYLYSYYYCLAIVLLHDQASFLKGLNAHRLQA